MTVLIAHKDAQPPSASSDYTPILFDRLSSDGGEWLARVFPSNSDLIPVVMARQQMAGHVDLFRPLDLLSSTFRIVRIGSTTFDLEGSLVDQAGRTVARSTTVFAVANRLTSRTSEIPVWLMRTLKRKGSRG